MRGRWVRAARLALIATSLAAVRPARAFEADAAPRAARDPRRVVVAVSVVGRPQDGAALTDTLRELFARLDLVVADGSSAPPNAVLARVRIDLTPPDGAAVLVTDGQSGEVIEERRVRRDPSPSIAREEIAHLVQSMVASRLLVDPERAPAPPPQPAPAPAPPIAIAPPELVPSHGAPTAEAPPPVPAPRGSFALDIATQAGGGPFASGSALQARVGGGVALGWRRGPRPTLAVTAAYALPTEASTSLVTSRASVVALRALASVEAVRTSGLAIVAGAGGGVDVLAIEPRSAVLPTSSLGEPSTRVDPILSATVGARFAISGSVVLTLDVVADLDLDARRYVLDVGGTQTTVLAPWRVRPMLLAGFAFTALGEGLFASAAPAPAMPRGGSP